MDHFSNDVELTHCAMQQNVVACEENHPYSLEKKLLLEHAISDLPPVSKQNFQIGLEL